MSTDPIRFAGGQTNLFVYANGDPVNRVDSNGKLYSCLDNLSRETAGCAGSCNDFVDTYGPQDTVVDSFIDWCTGADPKDRQNQRRLMQLTCENDCRQRALDSFEQCRVDTGSAGGTPEPCWDDACFAFNQ